MGEMKRVFKAVKFLPAVFVSVQILKKFSILNMYKKKHMERNPQKKLEMKKIWHN